MPKDGEVHSRAVLKPISEIAASIGIEKDRLYPYGEHIAKIRTEGLGGAQKKARYAVVTGINPASPKGEGKTTVAIGLAMALWRMGTRAILTLREPSMGPVFGIKGGATGGGLAQILPMEEINLHFTGDFHAVTQAQNLASALLGAHLFHGNALGIEPRSVWWPRVMDLNDRQLRHVISGLGGALEEGRFEITPACETMAILALTKSLPDLKERLERTGIGLDRQGGLVTLKDLGAAGAMAVLLKHALMPNLVQTSEQTPCFVHAGPFANIAHGASSVLADLLALELGDVVITEAGFGTDCGLEKLAHIKVPALGVDPDAAFLVVTLDGLLTHGGGSLKEGLKHLKKHIQNVHAFGLPCLVAVNVYEGDDHEGLQTLKEAALDVGAEGAALINAYALGSEGALELAGIFLETEPKTSGFQSVAPPDTPILDRLGILASRLYGADGVRLSPKAKKELDRIEALGLGRLPVNVAKTPMSLSHDPSLKGVPQGFIFPISGFRVASGAGFITAFAGEIQTMPGLPKSPAALRIGLDPSGKVLGVS